LQSGKKKRELKNPSRLDHPNHQQVLGNGQMKERKVEEETTSFSLLKFDHSTLLQLKAKSYYSLLIKSKQILPYWLSFKLVKQINYIKFSFIEDMRSFTAPKMKNLSSSVQIV